MWISKRPLKKSIDGVKVDDYFNHNTATYSVH